MANYPNMYAGQLTGGASTSPVTVTFGFDARYIRLWNSSSVIAFVNLGSSAPASTELTNARIGVTATQTWGIAELQAIPPIAGLSYQSTSTDGTGTLDVLALG